MSTSLNDLSKASLNSTDSLLDECESLWLLRGPPFDQRDYLMSPSESASIHQNDSSSTQETKRKLTPGDIKIDSKYLLDSHKALKKIIDIIKDDSAKRFVDRIRVLLKKFLQGSPVGFYYCDLPMVIEAVEYFTRNQSACPVFAEFVKLFMNNTLEPPKITKTSDLLNCKVIITDYFTLFGELLVNFHDTCFQLHLLKALTGLITRTKLLDVNCIKLSLCYDAMEDSQLPFVVATVLETVSPTLYPHYIDLALNMMLGSLKAGIIIAQNNALNSLCVRLNPFTPEDSQNLPLDSLDNCERESELIEYYAMLDKASYLIWGLLAIISRQNIEVPCPGEKALWSLRYVFIREVRRRCRRADDIRNNMCAIMIKMLSVFGEQLPLVQTGLAGGIVRYAIYCDIKFDKPYYHEFKFRTSKEDFILKKLMLLGCCLLSKCKNAIEFLKSEKVIQGVLHLLDYHKEQHSWNTTQYLSLFLIALRTLSEIVPQLPEEFVLSNGIPRIFDILKCFMEDHFDQDLLLETLNTLSAAVNCSSSACIIEDMKRQDGVALIMDLCAYLLKKESLKLKHQKELTRVFFILEKLFNNDQKLQNNFATEAVNISIKLLQRTLRDSKKDSKWVPEMFVTFGGFLWEAVAWCQKALKLFINSGGVFLLLDFIEISALPTQTLFLGVLVDMTEEGETIAHLLTWRGKDGIGALVMMVDIWKKEEILNRVPKAKNGVILDTGTPLMTAEQWYLTYQVREAHIYSPSIAEMFCSARPKIHALYQFLYHRYFDKIKVGEECYRLQMKSMKPSHMVYLPLFEHYLALKMGEIWFEVVRDAKISGAFPLSFNGDMLFKLIDEKNKWTARIKTMQEEIYVTHKGTDTTDEVNFYELLKSCRLACSLEALRELDYVTRTSNVEYLKKKKKEQTAEIEKSTTSLPFYSEIHRTYLGNTNVTVLNNDHIWMKSEKETVENEEFLLLSADYSTDNCFKFSGTISCEY